MLFHRTVFALLFGLVVAAGSAASDFEELQGRFSDRLNEMIETRASAVVSEKLTRALESMPAAPGATSVPPASMPAAPQEAAAVSDGSPGSQASSRP